MHGKNCRGGFVANNQAKYLIRDQHFARYSCSEKENEKQRKCHHKSNNHQSGLCILVVKQESKFFHNLIF
jgi:hypothetical protein